MRNLTVIRVQLQQLVFVCQ